MKSEMKTFVRDRDQALLSLDEKKIRAFCRKYNKPVSNNPVVFWAGIYKCILAMKNSPDHIRRQAEEWLDSHGFQRGFSAPDPLPEKREKFARHTFEHVVFPTEFYRWGERLVRQVTDGGRCYMSDLYTVSVEPDEHALQPYNPNFFKVFPRYYRNGDEETAIVCLELPMPSQVTECRRIYLCFNKATNDLMYFTSELSAQGTFYLCAWTKQHCHMILNPDPDLSEFDNVAWLFRELAGFDPSAIKAM